MVNTVNKKNVLTEYYYFYNLIKRLKTLKQRLQ
jgi:hypothetical protein